MLLGISSLMKAIHAHEADDWFPTLSSSLQGGDGLSGTTNADVLVGAGMPGLCILCLGILGSTSNCKGEHRSANVYSKSTLGPMKEGRLCTLGRLSFRSTSAATERLRLAPAKSLPRLTAALASSLLFLRLPKGIVTLLLGLWNSHMIWI